MARTPMNTANTYISSKQQIVTRNRKTFSDNSDSLPTLHVGLHVMSYSRNRKCLHKAEV